MLCLCLFCIRMASSFARELSSHVGLVLIRECRFEALHFFSHVGLVLFSALWRIDGLPFRPPCLRPAGETAL